MLPLLILLLLVSPSVLAGSGETFDESLDVRPLPDGKAAARFLFTSRSSGQANHHSLTPAPLLALLEAHGAESFQLSLTAGMWDFTRWGYPSCTAGGTGAEMWASMGDADGADERHYALMQSLSGLFCASLGQSLTNTFTTRPYVPHLTSPSKPAPFHTTSPPSGLCTENLTPFLKLLPSKGKSGLSGLLKSHRVLAGHWHSMSVKAERGKAIGTEEEAFWVEMSIEVVWDLVGRQQKGGLRDLRTKDLFKTEIPAPFPPASSSRITLQLPGDAAEEGQVWSVGDYENTFASAISRASAGIASWDLQSIGGVDDLTLLHYHDTTSFFVFPTTYTLPPLMYNRALLGSSQSEGAFLHTIINASPLNRTAILLEEWPWWVGGWLSERTVALNGTICDGLVPSLSYTPPLAHYRPTTLLTTLHLPAHSTIRINSPFLKQFLRYNEHLPDASRGFEIAPAILFPVKGEDEEEREQIPERLYSTNALVDLAIPDFSMPYNVIIMSSTLLALFFGSIFNLLTRSMIVLRVDDDDAISGATASVDKKERDETARTM